MARTKQVPGRMGIARSGRPRGVRMGTGALQMRPLPVKWYVHGGKASQLARVWSGRERPGCVTCSSDPDTSARCHEVLITGDLRTLQLPPRAAHFTSASLAPPASWVLRFHAGYQGSFSSGGGGVCVCVQNTDQSETLELGRSWEGREQPLGVLDRPQRLPGPRAARTRGPAGRRQPGCAGPGSSCSVCSRLVTRAPFS